MATPQGQPQVPRSPAATLPAQRLAIADKSPGGVPTDMESTEECHEMTTLRIGFLHPLAKIPTNMPLVY